MMAHVLTMISLGCFVVGGMIGPVAFPITHKRHGALHFARLGRLSLSWCVRRRAA